MATAPTHLNLPDARASRARRWLTVAVVVVALLAIYGLALRWITLQVGEDVQQSLRAVPTLDDHTPRTN